MPKYLQNKHALMKSLKSCTARRLVIEWDSSVRKAPRPGEQILSPAPVGYKSRPLVQPRTQFGRARATERRDKIYGFRALTLPCCARVVPVDISLSFPEICRRALLHHTTEHKKNFFYESPYQKISLIRELALFYS